MHTRQSGWFLFLAGCLVFLTGAVYNWQHAPVDSRMPLFTFVHISDTHCSRPGQVRKVNEPYLPFLQVGPYRSHWKDTPHSFLILEKTVQFINQSLKPDFLVHTGDVSENGRPEEIEAGLAVLRKLDCPFHLVWGDHDTPASSLDRGSTSFEYGNWRFVLLNIFPEEADLAFLDKELSGHPEKPVMLVSHRPIVCDRFTRWLVRNRYPGTEILMDNADSIRKILKQHRNVEIVLSGHLHSGFHWQVNGIHYITVSSLVEIPHQFQLVEVFPDTIIITVFIAPTLKDVTGGNWRKFHTEKIPRQRLRHEHGVSTREDFQAR